MKKTIAFLLVLWLGTLFLLWTNTRISIQYEKRIDMLEAYISQINRVVHKNGTVKVDQYTYDSASYVMDDYNNTTTLFFDIPYVHSKEPCITINANGNIEFLGYYKP